MKEWEKWQGFLQAVLNAEVEVQTAYRASGERGAWLDGNASPDVRPEVSLAAREMAAALAEEVDPDTERADRLMAKASARIQSAIEYADAHGFEEQSAILRDLPQLGYRAAAVDAWRDLRRSVRLGLDAATERAGLPLFPPASVQVRSGPKIGRNQPCPCGSGKKYKRCCGVAGAPS